MTETEAFNIASQLHRDGRVQEAEQAYRQILAGRPNHSLSSINLGTILHESRRFAEAARVYRAALVLDGTPREIWSNLGNTLFELEEYDQAIEACRAALAISPNLFSAHNNLGNALKLKGDLAAAISHYRKTIELAPDFPLAYSNLGTILHTQGKLEESITLFRRAIELSPGYAEAFSNLATSFGDLGRNDEAMAAFDTALAIRPDYATAHWNRGLLLLRTGDLERGWPEYDWRWKVPGLVKERMEFTVPKWNGENLAGRRIMLHSEQGYGDAIQFSRYASLVTQRGGRVVLNIQDELVRLFSGFRGAERVVGWNQPRPEIDLHCPLLDLPGIFNTTLQTIPATERYLSPDPALAAIWKERVRKVPGRKIGIAWAGRPEHSNDRARSMTLANFAPLAAAPDARFFSLQKGIAATQAKNSPFPLIDYTDELYDFAETAALIENLDLVIAADTSVVHLAAALGKPVWVFIPFTPDFRWLLNRNDSPWYPTMRLFRQERMEDWSTPISRAAEALKSQ
jgi:tetratricopeptide (TPR) repeat protein